MPPTSRKPKRWLLPSLAAASIGCVAAAAALWVTSGYRRPPTVPGVVLRFEARAVVNPFDLISVRRHAASPATISIIEGALDPARATSRLLEYPSGRSVRSKPLALGSSPPGEFDFDADGTPDEVTNVRRGSHVVIRVVSGASGAVLWEHLDPIEYGQLERGMPLGDLDEDGYAELAVVHARMDRSQYDWVLSDALLGARSWVSIVSGAHVPKL